MGRSAPRRRDARIVLIAGVAAWAGLSAASLAVLGAELHVTRAQRALESGGPPPSLVNDPGSPAARVGLLHALRLAQAAEPMSAGPRRQQLLDRAIQGVGQASHKRPAWGEAELVTAYAHALRDGLDDPRTWQALSASYRNAPFLRQAAAWRVAAALACWSRLSKQTQRAVVEEAVWISRIAPDTHPATLALMRGSDAYMAFVLRWRELRATDLN